MAARFEGGYCASADVSRPPGYAFFVAMMPGLRTVLVIQAFLGAALCIWLGVVRQHALGQWRRLTAATLLATEVPSIVYGRMIMSEALFKFLLTGAILLQLSAIIEDELNARTALGFCCRWSARRCDHDSAPPVFFCRCLHRFRFC